MNTAQHSRREALKGLAAVAAAAAITPAWLADEARAAEADKPKAPPQAPSEQFRIGLVGCGGMGTGDGKDSQRFGKVVAVCDVDKNHLANAKKAFPDAKDYTDFRKLVEQKDLDVVLCGTVDHWHTLVSIAALRAGKHVHCQKPLTLTIDEGKRLVAEWKKSGKVLQTGTQQRSDIRFARAVDILREGRIGKIRHVDVWVPAGLRGGPFKASEAPASLDWDFWQGQTPAVEYVKERAHRTFRYWWEYSGGTITDWGAHHNDIVLWALGKDRTGCVSVEGKPLIEMVPGGYTASSEYEITWTYDNGITHTCHTTKDSQWNGAPAEPKRKDAQYHGIKFLGENGWLWVTRGELKASDPEILKQEPSTGPKKIYDHKGNFFTAIKEKKQPNCDADIGHRSATMCHLGAAAVRLGRKLAWDPVKEEYVGDAEANKTLAREQRKPYTYEMI